MSNDPSNERFEELESLRTQLGVSFGLVGSMVDTWLPGKGINEDIAEDDADETDPFAVARHNQRFRYY